jgi:hypothetical protein
MTTYRDLYNEALTKIKKVCQNVTNFGIFGNVPREVKEGYTHTATVLGAEVRDKDGNLDPEGNKHRKTIKARFSINNPITQVSAEVVDKQFKDYMTDCGFIPILDSITTPRGELLFMMAVAEFVTAKIYTAQVRSRTAKSPCYNQYTTPTVVYYNNEPIIKKEDTNINDAILKNTAQVKVNYTHGFVQ